MTKWANAIALPLCGLTGQQRGFAATMSRPAFKPCHFSLIIADQNRRII